MPKTLDPDNPKTLTGLRNPKSVNPQTPNPRLLTLKHTTPFHKAEAEAAAAAVGVAGGSGGGGGSGSGGGGMGWEMGFSVAPAHIYEVGGRQTLNPGLLFRVWDLGFRV